MSSASRFIELVIFDLDGTLIHSAPDIVATTNELMHRRNRPLLSETVIVNAIGEGLMELIYNCFPDVKDDRAEIELITRDFARVYEENLLKRTTIYDGVLQFLDEASTGSRPRKVAIVTNKRIAWTRKTLAGLKLDRFPWVKVFGADSLSERKPHPLPLLEVMKAAGLGPERTVMVGDGLPDMRAAGRAGVPAIGCTYGYCSAEKLTNAGASYLIESPFGLNSALEKVETPLSRTPMF